MALKPLYSIDDLTNMVNGAIDTLPIPNNPKKLYDPIRYVLAVGGKRIRPVLMLMSYNMYKDNNCNTLYPYHTERKCQNHFHP